MTYSFQSIISSTSQLSLLPLSSSWCLYQQNRFLDFFLPYSFTTLSKNILLSTAAEEFTLTASLPESRVFIDLVIWLFHSALEKISKVIISGLPEALTQKGSPCPEVLTLRSSPPHMYPRGGDGDDNLLLCYVFECGCLYICMYVCAAHVCLVLTDATRGYQIPRTGIIDGCCHVGPGNQFQTICCTPG